MAGTLILEFVAPHTYQRKFTTTDIDSMLDASHHYVITRGPRVRVARAEVTSPTSVTFWLNASTMRVINPFVLEASHLEGLEVQVLHDGQYWVIRDSKGALFAHGSAWALASATSQRLDVLANHEVIYIGKSLRDPETPRSSSTRLKAHATLQRIYEDHSAADSFDIFITPLLLGNVTFWSTSYIDSDLGDLDLEKALPFMKKVASEPMRVGLAEEVLIGYFKPMYNSLLKEWGTTRTVPVRAALSAGFRIVAVTLSAWHGLARFGSPSVSPKLAHVATFVLGRRGHAPDTAGDGVNSLFSPLALSGPLEAKVEATAVQIGVFGNALPQPAPWGLSIPDERIVR